MNESRVNVGRACVPQTGGAESERNPVATAELWGRSIDSVVVLAWSDWKTEPRSNRYHFATRFARQVPVFFVQPDPTSNEIWLEAVEFNITLVHAPMIYDVEAAKELAAALYSAGCHKPLLWIYNFVFEEYILRSNAVLRVMHATEDYFTKPEGWAVAEPGLSDILTRILKYIDLLVAVSPGVLESYLADSKYRGAALLLKNGCDAKFWYERRAFEYEPAENGPPVALFQGGINKRIDFPLLIALARRLPRWEFWFCGDDGSRPEGWKELRNSPNVRYLGVQTVEGIASLARQAAVGLIPFQQDELIRRSLPLKAYEYVACGMPVVSVPIDALASSPDLFRFASNVEEFALALEQIRSTRNDPVAVERRLTAAEAESYDNRFGLLIETLTRHIERVRNRKTPGHRYNILLLYDDVYTYVSTIAEHIQALQRYSGHNVVLAPATGHVPSVDDVETVVDFNAFDALVIHYSVRLSIEDHLSKRMAEAIAAYDGPKLLYIQDEYENTETARRWIERLDIDTVFTCVPLDQLENAYPRKRFPKVDFVETLTGYVPEDPSIDSYAMALADRRTVIGYRGRRLPHHYGLLGQEKIRIGIEVRDRAARLGLPVDIEIDEAHRIYGNDWYRFVGSCRATLGTESGANVFDEDGELKRLAAEHSLAPFDEFARNYLGPYEGKVRMNQISPKIFEAIRLRTALVLFEGSYSGVVKPDVHFIPLKKDFSNFDEVVEKVNSLDYLQTLTERAYRDIIESGRWSYRTFAEDFSRYLSGRLLGRPPRARIISSPLLAFQGGGSPTMVWPSSLMRGLASGQILDNRVGRSEVLSAMGESVVAEAVDLHRTTRYEKLRRRALTRLRRLALRIPGLPWTVRALRRLLLVQP